MGGGGVCGTSVKQKRGRVKGWVVNELHFHFHFYPFSLVRRKVHNFLSAVGAHLATSRAVSFIIRVVKQPDWASFHKPQSPSVPCPDLGISRCHAAQY